MAKPEETKQPEQAHHFTDTQLKAYIAAAVEAALGERAPAARTNDELAAEHSARTQPRGEPPEFVILADANMGAITLDWSDFPGLLFIARRLRFLDRFCGWRFGLGLRLLGRGSGFLGGGGWFCDRFRRWLGHKHRRFGNRLRSW